MLSQDDVFRALATLIPTSDSDADVDQEFTLVDELDDCMSVKDYVAFVCKLRSCDEPTAYRIITETLIGSGDC